MTYCDASDWMAASLISCVDCMSRDSKIVQSVKKRLDELINLMDQYSKDLNTHTTRLQIVRETKKERLNHWIEMGKSRHVCSRLLYLLFVVCTYPSYVQMYITIRRMLTCNIFVRLK